MLWILASKSPLADSSQPGERLSDVTHTEGWAPAGEMSIGENTVATASVKPFYLCAHVERLDIYSMMSSL